MKSPACRLYLITPPAFDPGPFAGALAAAMDGGDVAAVQLRRKGAARDDVLRAAEILRPIVQDRRAAFIVNDDPELARESGADGVHIGQDDATYAEARAAVGDDGIVGVTCHDSRHLAMIAGEMGADYVAFGAFFPTATKQPKGRADIALLEYWAEDMTVPVVAIGGITVENCPPLVRAGADFLAVVSAVWDCPDGPAAAVAAFNRAIAEA